MSYILKFVSGLGEFTMGGGRHDFFRLSAVHGLGFPEVERQTVIYSGRRGEKTLSTRFLPRVITISGDIVKKDSLSDVTRILSEKGTLYIITQNGEKKAEVIVTSMEEAEKIGDITRVVIQLIADDPAFFDTSCERVGIYERVDLVEGSFSPPCVFTKRVCGGNVKNSGDLTSEPIIYVTCNKASSAESTLIITNENTKAKISLKRKFTVGDVITINTKTAEITDLYGNSLLSAMSDDTYLSEFVLVRGDNNISVVSTELSSDLQVVCSFQKRYLEAVI